MIPVAAAYPASAIIAALGAARTKAESLGVAMAISIVTAEGRQVGSLAMPGSFLASPDYAYQKAYTAACFGMETDDFRELTTSLPEPVGAELCTHPNVTRLPGGLPILLQDGSMIAAIGTSGGDGDQDRAVVRAGRDGFLSAL